MILNSNINDSFIFLFTFTKLHVHVNITKSFGMKWDTHNFTIGIYPHTLKHASILLVITHTGVHNGIQTKIELPWK